MYHKVAYNTALLVDTDSVFHGVDRVAPGDAVDLPALKPGMQLAFDGDGRWSVRDGDHAVADYRWDELRFSISWKAYCFADEAERDAWRTHTDDLVARRDPRHTRRRPAIAGPHHRRYARRRASSRCMIIDEYIRFPPSVAA